MKFKTIAFITVVFCTVALQAQTTALWLRYPSISPNGKTISFNYKGDIYTVANKGGIANQITTHTAHDFNSIWSNDGEKIAFASDRYGNYDIFEVNAKGGKAIRKTFNSSNDIPFSYQNDNQTIVFGSSRLDAPENAQFPSGVLAELYTVDQQGKIKQTLTTPAEKAIWNKANDELIYHDRKGYENTWRKHHTSSVTRDLWIYDKNTKEHTQLTTFEGEDRNPVFNNDETTIYYLSEKSGSFNIWKFNLTHPTVKTQVTKFEKFPVRFLSISNNNLLSFSFNGELYTLKDGEEAKKITVLIQSDDNYNSTVLKNVKAEVSELALSPDGKEIAYISHGEIFVTASDYSKTKRITNTPEQERTLSFSPDGKSLLYASDRNGSWNLYKTSLTQKDEKNFYNSTVLKENDVLVNAKETFQPSYSPDGKEVAYLEERTTLKVLNIASKTSRIILPGTKNYSYSDGDQYYEWSPDGKWFLVTYFSSNRWNSDVGLVDAQGKKIINLTESGYECSSPKWMMGGKMLIWFSGRNGMRSHGSWGNQTDVYGLFLNKDAYQVFNMSKDEFATYNEKLKEEKAAKTKEDKKKKSKDKKEKTTKPLHFDFENFRDRTKRLTIHSSSLADALLTKDGSKLFYLSKFEKKYDLWVHDFKENETKLFVKLGSNGGNLKLDKKEKNIFVLSNNKMYKINIASKKKENVSYSAKIDWNADKEREFIYDHVWRQTLKKFYKVDMHGVDWAFYKESYRKFLPSINNDKDFAELLSELLGELNASHTGSGAGSSIKNKDKTASFAFYPDYTHRGKGIKIKEIMDKSPLLNVKKYTPKKGDIIEKLNAITINNLSHYYQLLNHQIGTTFLLTIKDVNQKTHHVKAKAISINREHQLVYQRWVKRNEINVAKLSNNKVGYVHVKGMNDESFRETYSKALGKYEDMDALIVDTRFNGGGWLHDDLATFLSGKKYATFLPRGQDVGKEPQSKWYKKSIVLIGEGNYSDAHGFPFAYRALKIGKTVGMPVPGTMTAVWWETQINRNIYFGIPQVGMMDNSGKLQENYQFEPDFKVSNDYKTVAEGKDKQLEKAVEEMLK